MSSPGQDIAGGARLVWQSAPPARPVAESQDVMNEQPNRDSRQAQLATAHLPHKLNFNALKTHRRDALATHGIPKLSFVNLLKVKYVQRGIHRRVVTKEADDLFATTSHDTTLFPDDADATSATLAFGVTDSSQTHEVELCLPNVIRCKSATHLALFLLWLSKSALNAAQNLACAALILFLAVSATAPPFPDDDPTDTDDNDSHRHCAQSA